MYTLIEIALSVGVLVTLVTVLSLCVCGCKNSNQKSELGGTAGVVKIRFDEEAPSPTPTTPASVKRASTQNSQRSLPEIPQPVGRHDSGDTASEIYATVNLDEGNKIVAEASTSRDHPYEHAYAKLQNESHNIVVEITPDPREDEIQIDERDASQSAAESVVISARVAISGQLPSSHELPYITPPSPRPEPQHYSGDSTDSAKGYTSISVREPLSNIRAHTVPAPAHYATVSDDSDEMYAAIEEASTGEGSDTYAQIAPEPRRRARPAAADAARRSAPPEIGASTSQATHSRQASSSSCSNSTGALGSPKPEKRQANSPLPPPPPAHPAYAAHAAHTAHTAHAAHPALDARSHQRISSTGDLFSGDKFRRSLNEKHTRNNSCVSSSDFYGCNYPVDKHRFSSADLLRKETRETREARETRETREAREAREPDPPPTSKNLYKSVDGDEPDAGLSDSRVTESPSRNVEEMYAKVIKKAKTKTQEDPVRANPDDEPAKPKYRTDDPGYETIDRKKSNHGYETIARKERKISQNQDPGYETVKDFNKVPNSNFANNNMVKLNHADSGPNSIISSDAGYEHICKLDGSASDSEPSYEVLRGQPPAYAAVRRRAPAAWPGDHAHLAEANYESMPHDPLYKGSGSESDPNYESVRPKDPNYESVSAQDPNYESLRLKDPKYESVRSKASKSDSMRSKKDPNYESVKYFELAKKEPPYEKVNHEATGPGVERSDSSAGYEKINVPARGVPNGADVVSDYFQV